jgi:hypothetical protein
VQLVQEPAADGTLIRDTGVPPVPGDVVRE